MVFIIGSAATLSFVFFVQMHIMLPKGLKQERKVGKDD